MIATCPLGDVVDVSAGQPAPKSNEFGVDGQPFIRAGSLETLLNGGSLSDCERVPEHTAKRRRLRLYPKDTIVFAKSGMSATLGRVYRLAEPAYVVSHLAALVPTGRYDPAYLTYWLRSNPPSHLIKDSAYPSIRVSEIQSVSVPDVPLSEQQKIARELDKADGIRRKREQTLAMANDVLKAAFLEMFGDPVHNPRGWPIIAVGELGEVQGGLQVSKKRDVLPMRRPYLRVANVYRDKLDLLEIKQIGLTEPEFNRTRLQVGDVLIVEGHGNPDEIGRTCVWDGSIADCTHQNHLIRFRANQRKVSPVYLSRLLNSESGRLQLIAAGRTTSGLNTISTKKVKEVKIPLPPIEAQQAFERLVTVQGQSVQQMHRSLLESNVLMASLSQRAFRGEL